MATLMTSPDGAQYAIVGLTEQEVGLIRRALHEWWEYARLDASMAEAEATVRLLKDLDD